MNIILIGFMGAGKSSVAKQLAPLLKLPALEMDEVALQKTKTRDMHELFSKGGELLLREIEIAIAQEYASTDHGMVISTGGGVVLNKIILDYLRKDSGRIFFLNASFETIAARIVADDRQRPLFKNRVEAHALYHFRLPLYLKYADQVIDVNDKSVEEVTQEIVRRLSHGK